MNAHQRRIVRRALDRAIRRTTNRYDEGQARGGRWATLPADFVREVPWWRVIEVAVRPKREADSDRSARRPDAVRKAVHRALDRVLTGWVRWSESADVLVTKIAVADIARIPVTDTDLLLNPVPLSLFDPVFGALRTAVLLCEDQRIRVNVRALPMTCGPVTIQMAATVVNMQGKTFLGGGLLARLDPGAVGTLWHDVLGPCQLAGVAFDWRPIEPWDRRLSRYLETT